LKNAVAWCTFEKRNKFYQSTRIEQLDTAIGSINVSINIHQTLIKKSKELDKKMIYIAKLNEERLRRKSMATEMNSYIVESKYWQTKKFAQTEQNVYGKINTL
jgi:sulfur carrier protein ThiS